MKKVQTIQVGIVKNRISKLKISIASTLLILGLAASPAQADHYRHIIAPLATVAALAYLFNHGDSHTTYKRKSYRSYGYNNNGSHHGQRNYSHRKHSYSSGGYSHRKHSYSSGGYSHQSKKRYQH